MCLCKVNLQHYCSYMRKYTLLHISIASLLSILFLFMGTGYNLVHYCCNSCKSANTHAIVAEACTCSGYTNTQKILCKTCLADKSCCGTDDAHVDITHHKPCSIERLTVDIPVFSKQELSFEKITLPVITLFYPHLTDVLLIRDKSLPDSPFPLEHTLLFSGREILSQHSVLLI